MALRPWSSFALAISASDQETFELNEFVFAHLERLAEGSRGPGRADVARPCVA